MKISLVDNTEVVCDWVQPYYNNTLMKCFVNTAGGCWMKELVKIKEIISIKEGK